MPMKITIAGMFKTIQEKAKNMLGKPINNVSSTELPAEKFA